MKRPSLNSAAIGNFFLHHVEKLVFVLAASGSLLLLWWGIDAIRTQSVDRGRTPEAITDLARQATANIDRLQQVPPDRFPAASPLAPRVEPWRPQQVKVAAAPAAPPVFKRPLFAELTKRTVPEVLPVSDLRAVAGIAVLPDPAAAARAVAQPRQPELPTEPEPENPRRAPRRNPRGAPPREQAGEGLFGSGEGLGPLPSDLAAEEPLEPGRITPFVVVTGLIPAARQVEAFDRSFATASFRDARRDVPRWADYIVERTRVVPDAAPRWERMKLVNVVRQGQEVGRPGSGPLPGGEAGPALVAETLPAEFFLQPTESEIGYAAALPERIDEPWGEEALHPWFEPLLRERTEISGAEKPGVEEEWAPVTLADLVAKPREFVGRQLRLEGVALDPTSKQQRNIGLHMFGVRAADGGPAIEPGAIGFKDQLVFATAAEFGAKLSFDLTGDKARPCRLNVRIDMVGRTPVARMLEVELLDQAGELAAAHTETEPRPVEVTPEMGLGTPVGESLFSGDSGRAGPLAASRLFRFLDQTVEPGAEYRYRVRFALRNPNLSLAPQHVADVASTKAEYLYSPFSNETAPVRVPGPTRLLARTMSRDAARRLKVKGETVEVIALGESAETGNFALRSVVTGVGGLANVDPALNRPGETRCFGQPLQTDRLLIDTRGSQEERTEARDSAPAPPLEMLFLNKNGEFEVVSAADSAPLWARYRGTLLRPGADVPEAGKPPARGREPPPRGSP